MRIQGSRAALERGLRLGLSATDRDLRRIVQEVWLLVRRSSRQYNRDGARCRAEQTSRSSRNQADDVVSSKRGDEKCSQHSRRAETITRLFGTDLLVLGGCERVASGECAWI